VNVVFLFDVDNTLLDNDRVAADLRAHLETEVGTDCSLRYWEIFEELRAELGYADYLGALQRYRSLRPRDLRILTVSHYLISYPFANRLFPGSLDVLGQCGSIGTAAILTDGDAVFQPRKIWSSGLHDAVGGRVLVYIHKELELDDVCGRLPADRYVLVDDKVRILTAVKAAWGHRVTTVFARQGHYALDAAETARYPPPDLTIERIGDLVEHDLDGLIAAARPA
jgi:FMN phosphatase YigB (HAD superfamily)